MGSQEVEAGYGKARVKARGLLAIKSLFIGVMTLLYLYVILPGLRLEVLVATEVYLLGVIIFVAVFFGSWRLTFVSKQDRRRRQKRKVAESRGLDKYAG